MRDIMIQNMIDREMWGQNFTLTPSQKKAITRIIAKGLDRATGDDAQVKKLSINEISNGRVSVYVVTGMFGDEGTLAKTFCRYHGHFFIGKRGGIKSAKLLTAKHGEKGVLKKYPLIYGWNR